MARLRLATWPHPTSPSPSSPDSRPLDCIKQSPRSPPELVPSSFEEKKYHHCPKIQLQPDTTNTMVRIAPGPRGKNTASPSTMIALAQKISAETEKVDAYFRDKGLPAPSFDVDAPSDFPKMPDDISRSRREVIHATQELHDLMIGPRESVRWMAWDFMSTQCLQLINHYGIAQLVPLDGSITLAQLEAKTTLDPINLARVVRYGATNRLFQEPRPGVIAHTAASRLLVEDPSLRAWVGFNTEDLYPASAHVLDALRRFPEATSLQRTGFNVAFNTIDQEPMFVTFGRDAERARRMGNAMRSLTGGEGYELAHLTTVTTTTTTGAGQGAAATTATGPLLDLAAEDARGGTLVDVGGSHGFACAHLAERYRGIQFVVQDLARTVESAPRPAHADAQVARRIQFEAHDFFTEQPVRGADVYFLRWIMHNYSTPYAVRILRNLVPALKPGARVVINDHCLREPGEEDPWDERHIRGMDLVMMTLLNAQERGEHDFRRLFEMAGDHFVFKGVTRAKDCRMSIIEAVWEPNEAIDEVSHPRHERSSLPL
ncbi:S-adenosyl-L-methionine-dependent methyltransferase [Durotheca rogersii]|uniref:S-adenosyl-L-methionine-dependent methyltransferase n=1 Tax=Durotheca rogersii TaxID=419775 RepID=UPI00221E78CA|nr:S-adenosyl-L-methionine-dependent methyltransferase [Durotheca rogersii]KAI5867814.1 S-adenosyl-L-methionine-dependent methyltransferase [Durotheca rogersii]